MTTQPAIRFGVIGLDHGHIYGQVNLLRRAGGNHLFLVDQTGTPYFDCNNVDLPYGRQLVYDILHHTETAMSQTHCFLASELSLQSQRQAKRLGNLKNDK